MDRTRKPCLQKTEGEKLPLPETPEVKRNVFPRERFFKFALHLLVGADSIDNHLEMK